MRPERSPTRRQLNTLVQVIFIATCAAPLHASGNCDPRAFGAKGDGISKDTLAIQAAIDACEESGGGTVQLSAGTYMTAPIELKSNIILRLDKGAILLGSSDHQDYPPRTEFRLPDLQPLVSAKNSTNITIIGEGVIDGAGDNWWQEARNIKDHGILGAGHPRPKLIVFDHCKDIVVEDVTVQNSPMWQLVAYYSDDVVIRNVRILAPPHSPNTDAVDLFSSSHVIIDHVFADVGDDDVAVKSGTINSPGPDSPSRDIIITDCTFLHGHGLSVGSEIAGGAQNILAERIHFEGTDNGIRIKANRDRGNDVGHLVFREIEMKNVKNALVISEYYPNILPAGNETTHPVTRLTPHFHDITLENVTASGSETAAIIVGLPEAPISRVTLRHVNISARKGITVGYADVSGEDVVVHVDDGQPITKIDGAKVTIR